MARLSIKTAELGAARSLELKLGVTRVGRSPDVDFQISHPTISSCHCELLLGEEGVVLRDLDSTNGTFVDGEPVRERRLAAGQIVRLGDIELLVEATDVSVAIPSFVDLDLPAPPVVTGDGQMTCPRHAQSAASYQCSGCKTVMCSLCVHQVRRRGGNTTLLLCPHCGKRVDRIGGPKKPARKSFFARASETVKMKVARALNLSGNKQ